MIAYGIIFFSWNLETSYARLSIASRKNSEKKNTSIPVSSNHFWVVFLTHTYTCRHLYTYIHTQHIHNTHACANISIQKLQIYSDECIQQALTSDADVTRPYNHRTHNNTTPQAIVHRIEDKRERSMMMYLLFYMFY